MTCPTVRAASKETYISATSFALIHVGLGDKEQAFTWLEQDREKPHEEGFSLVFLKADPIWELLPSDPRFASLLRRMGLPP